jgi:hypothetical protein
MTDLERLARLETAVPEIQKTLAEVRGDVKTLLAAHNAQRGFARLGLVVWTTVAGVAGGVATMFAGKHL